METRRLVDPQSSRGIPRFLTSVRRLKRPYLLVWLAILPLFWWALRRVPLGEVFSALSGLSLWQLSAILIVNGGIILLFGLRWWLILRAQGHVLPYLDTTRYRLAAFAVSYFTPGPQFGGEPLQVYYVRRDHGVPATTAVAAITLDKVLELVSNFSFLVFGVVVSLGSQAFDALMLYRALPLALALFCLPLAYLALVWSGRLPLSWLLRRIPGGLAARVVGGERLLTSIHSTEAQVSDFCRRRPVVILQSLAVAVLVWSAVVFEFWIVLQFLGLSVNAWQVIVVVTVARLALLTPLPGGLGALEAGEVLAMQALGFDPAYGLGLGLLVRARDVLVGMAGIWWGARPTR